MHIPRAARFRSFVIAGLVVATVVVTAPNSGATTSTATATSSELSTRS